jgi:CTP:molybdopterin cytidylyltransferase MocA
VTPAAGLLLAAGAGRRFGGPKALVELEGEPLVRRGVQLLRDGGCAPVLVVVGARADDVVAVLDGAADVVRAPDWERGMGASLRAGLDAVETHRAEACVVALVDQPRVGAEAVRRVCLADPAGRFGAVVATYEGRPRHPVLLRRRVWGDVAELARDDTGARAWLRAHPDDVLTIGCDDTGSPFDVDTAADLAVLRSPPSGVSV